MPFGGSPEPFTGSNAKLRRRERKICCRVGLPRARLRRLRLGGGEILVWPPYWWTIGPFEGDSKPQELIEPAKWREREFMT